MPLLDHRATGRSLGLSISRVCGKGGPAHHCSRPNARGRTQEGSGKQLGAVAGQSMPCAGMEVKGSAMGSHVGNMCPGEGASSLQEQSIISLLDPRQLPPASQLPSALQAAWESWGSPRGLVGVLGRIELGLD